MQVAEALIGDAGTWRKRLTDGNYVAVPKISTEDVLATDANSKTVQGSKKTAAAIAAEVADKLAASTSSQYIMSSVLSTFAAEEAKTAGLAKISSANSFPPMPMTPSNSNGIPNHTPVSTSDQNIYDATQSQAIAGQQNIPYQSVYVSQPVIQTPTPNPQAQYQLIAQAPPPQKQFIQPAGGVMTQYGYGSVPPMPQGQPPAHHMVSPMMQMQQPQLQQQQFIPATPHLPPPPSFRPIQSPRTVFFAQPRYNL